MLETLRCPHTAEDRWSQCRCHGRRKSIPDIMLCVSGLWTCVFITLPTAPQFWILFFSLWPMRRRDHTMKKCHVHPRVMAQWYSPCLGPWDLIGGLWVQPQWCAGESPAGRLSMNLSSTCLEAATTSWSGLPWCSKNQKKGVLSSYHPS
jgi:hypothetical protein